eukprot:1002585-Alexandrium_andersonii.AAC.1
MTCAAGSLAVCSVLQFTSSAGIHDDFHVDRVLQFAVSCSLQCLAIHVDVTVSCNPLATT